jgi:nicotinate-nucleotide adenylyltransferase
MTSGSSGPAAGPPGAPGTPAPRGGGVRGLGVLGGSFNPPHATHLRLTRSALARLPIAEVRVIPAGDHPHKQGRDMAPAHHRAAMCRLLFAREPGVVVDERELHRAGPSFTVDTLRELRAEQPERPLWFLIGSDNLPLLPTWRDVHGILALCTVVTWPRAGHPVTPEVVARLPLPPAAQQSLLAHVLDVPADAIAASDLRARWRAGEHDLPELAPDVRAYIAAHGLYR